MQVTTLADNEVLQEVHFISIICLCITKKGYDKSVLKPLHCRGL